MNLLTPPVKSIHIELTNICTLQCPGCARTQFINQWPQHWKNHSIDPEHLLNFIDVEVEHVLFCGNEGDPIYHKEFLFIVEQFKKRNVVVSIMTNGSHKDKIWWDSVTNLLTQQDIVIFSIDGLPHTSPQYRINSDWESIKIGIDSVVNSRCRSRWKFIPFKFIRDSQ